MFRVFCVSSLKICLFSVTVKEPTSDIHRKSGNSFYLSVFSLFTRNVSDQRQLDATLTGRQGSFLVATFLKTKIGSYLQYNNFIYSLVLSFLSVEQQIVNLTITFIHRINNVDAQ